MQWRRVWLCIFIRVLYTENNLNLKPLAALYSEHKHTNLKTKHINQHNHKISHIKVKRRLNSMLKISTINFQLVILDLYILKLHLTYFYCSLYFRMGINTKGKKGLKKRWVKNKELLKQIEYINKNILKTKIIYMYTKTKWRKYISKDRFDTWRTNCLDAFICVYLNKLCVVYRWWEFLEIIAKHRRILFLSRLYTHSKSIV